jgi:hypothetical protein
MTTLTKKEELLGVDYLNAELSQDEIDIDGGIHTEGESLVYQFYCGNWSPSVQVMKDRVIEWHELLDFIGLHEGWKAELEMHKHFDHEFWGELGYALGKNTYTN